MEYKFVSNMITAIVLTHNEEEMLPNCLKTLDWVDEIIVSDKGSIDKTVEIAQRAGAKIHHFEGIYFDDWRNQALKQASGEWVLFIDPDERVTVFLKNEIQMILTGNGESNFSAYRVKRINYWWGKRFYACGASNDRVHKLFYRSKLKQWRGIIHESPEFEGESGDLEGGLIHLTHRNLDSVLKKSSQWTRFEAELFAKTDHPKITWPRLFKIFITAFWQKFIMQKGFKDGTEGFIESMVQAWNRFMVYEQLWEMQQKPSLAEKYKQIDKNTSN